VYAQAAYLYPYQVLSVTFTGAEVYTAVASTNASGSIDTMVSSQNAFNVSYCTNVPPPTVTVVKTCNAVNMSADGTQVQYEVSITVTNSNTSQIDGFGLYSIYMPPFTLPGNVSKGETVGNTTTFWSDQWNYWMDSDTIALAYDNNKRSVVIYDNPIICNTSGLSVNSFATLGTVCNINYNTGTFYLNDTVCNQGNVAAVLTVGDSYGNTHGQVTVSPNMCANLTGPVESVWTESMGFVSATGITLLGGLPISITAPYACSMG